MNWHELKKASLDEVLAWAESQPWCQAMANCDQDSEWHSEGDVWTHTKMVCHQLAKLEEWPTLTPKEQTVLIFTALLHDAAKPLTSQTDPETGRITSPNHAVKGEYVARSVLRDLGCDLVTREEISHLVRYHGRPAFLLDRSEPTHEVVRLSWLVKNKLLHLFAVADSRGRDTDSMSRPEENLDYWKLLAEETDCYDQPYPFSSEHARFVFYREQKPNLYYVPHEAFSCDVTMMSGLPGSGKDTWLARNCPGLPVVSLDDIREELCVEPTENQGKVVQLARQRCRELLRARTSFAFNATNLLRHIRKRWIDLFADYKAHIRLVYLEPPIDKLLLQNRNRPNSVPEDVVRKMAARCDPPTWAEGHQLFMIDGSSGGHGEENQASGWDAS